MGKVFHPFDESHPHGAKAEGRRSLPYLPVRGAIRSYSSRSALVLLPEFAIVLAVEHLGQKHERPIVRMERQDLARSVEDRPGRAGLVTGNPLFDECAP